MRRGSAGQRGFSLLFVLMLVAAIGLGLTVAGGLWQTDARREREAELLFVGNAYRQAIQRYYELDPGQPVLPQTVDELLADPRRPTVVRHLRRAYRDPMTGRDFALVRAPDTQGILGVRSTDATTPLKQSGFAAENESFTGAGSYTEWLFVFKPAAAPALPPGTPAPPSGTPAPAPAPGRTGP